MPKVIQVREVPDEVHGVLRERAAAAGMSLSDYARRELVLLAERPSVADVLMQAQERPGRVPFGVGTELIRRARDHDE